MSNRLMNEVWAVVLWGTVHLLCLAMGSAAYFVAGSSTMAKQSSQLDVGGVQVQPLPQVGMTADNANAMKPEDVKANPSEPADEPKLTSTESTDSPDTSDEADPAQAVAKLPSPNIVEPAPRPIGRMSPTQVQDTAASYRASLRQKDIQIVLGTKRPGDLARLGSRYLFRLPDDRTIFLDNDGGDVRHVLDAGYAIQIDRRWISPRVINALVQKAGAKAERAACSMELDPRWVVLMHRSLFAYLDSQHSGDLPSGHCFQAMVDPDTYQFQWTDLGTIR